MSDKQVVESLLKCLANTYGLYLLTQNYHWNVVGPNFYALHKLFEEQYRDLFAAMDELAERVRALGEKVPNHQDLMSKYNKVKSADIYLTPEDMVDHLAGENVSLVSMLKEASNIFADHDDKASEDLVIGRMFTHDKAAWMLRVYLKG